MKKEFKAPIIETKVLSTVNSIMDDGILLSATQTQAGYAVNDGTVAESFKQWKGSKKD